jgi:hypothetical protein
MENDNCMEFSYEQGDRSVIERIAENYEVNVVFPESDEDKAYFWGEEFESYAEELESALDAEPDSDISTSMKAIDGMLSNEKPLPDGGDKSNSMAGMGAVESGPTGSYEEPDVKMYNLPQ